ncbi:hypothetical protein ABTC22_18810, partial [Acinetobacter baumannii]
GLLMGAQLLVREPRIVDDVGHGRSCLMDVLGTSACRSGCACGIAAQISRTMKSFVAALAALLLLSSSVTAQTLEADMRAAAAAYEGKD